MNFSSFTLLIDKKGYYNQPNCTFVLIVMGDNVLIKTMLFVKRKRLLQPRVFEPKTS